MPEFLEWCEMDFVHPQVSFYFLCGQGMEFALTLRVAHLVLFHSRKLSHAAQSLKYEGGDPLVVPHFPLADG